MTTLLEKYKQYKDNYGFNFQQCCSRKIKSLKDKLYYKKNYYYSGSDNNITEAAHSAWIYKKITKRYNNIMSSKPSTDNKWKNKEMPKIIWWCWLQGIDNIPELSSVCLKSLKRQLPEYKIVLITLDNLKDYVKLPKIIYAKFNAGWISGAHFSDVIRLALLAKYGGIWIDSTVYCTDAKTVKIIENSDMFMYQNLMSSNSNVIRMSNWLMATKKGNPFFKEASQLLNDYYVTNSYTEDYFICHLILTMLSNKYSEIWNGMEIINNTDPHMLQLKLNDRFSSSVYQRILTKSSFHKLNRHLDLRKGDTFYNHIKNEVGL